MPKKIYGKPFDFRTPKARKIRSSIFQRDGFVCVVCKDKAVSIPQNYCGKNTLYTKNGWLEIDHIVSRKNNGTNNLENLRTVCNVCNCKKGGI